MAKTCKSIKELLNYLQTQVIPDVLQTECKQEVVSVNIKHNQSDIYNIATPKEYNRRMSLTDENNFVGEMVDNNTIKIYNNAEPNDSVMGMPVDQYQLQWLVEEGASPAPFGEGFWTEERPAVKNTFEELRESNELIKSAKRGLKRFKIDTV